jgi:hypothetical protein
MGCFLASLCLSHCSWTSPQRHSRIVWKLRHRCPRRIGGRLLARGGPRSSLAAALGRCQRTASRSAAWTPSPLRCFGSASAPGRTLRLSIPPGQRIAPSVGGRCLRRSGKLVSVPFRSIAPAVATKIAQEDDDNQITFREKSCTPA